MNLNEADTANAGSRAAFSEFSDSGAEKSGGAAFYSKLFLLYFLNIIDWICTEALIGTGEFYEANPIMKPILQSFWLTVSVKGVLPLVLVILCAFIYKLAGCEEIPATNILLYTGIAAYILVNLWHILNFILLFFSF